MAFKKIRVEPCWNKPVEEQENLFKQKADGQSPYIKHVKQGILSRTKFTCCLNFQ